MADSQTVTPDESRSGSFQSSDRTRLRRARDRGTFDRATVEAILDEGLVAHVGLQTERGPIVLPMAYARIDDVLYLHGAASNHLLSHTGDGIEVCVTVTLLDGLVMARSWFHHSMNYRCVVMMGTVQPVIDIDEKMAASKALVEHVEPGRSDQSRPPTDAELTKTLIVSLPIDEVSAKVRDGGPHDEPEDMLLPYWAGHIPTRLVRDSPIDDPTPIP